MAKARTIKAVDGRTLKGKIANMITRDLIWLVSKARETSEYEDKTFNLHDSYGAAVYDNGVLIEKSITYLEPLATKTKNWYDREGITGHEEMITYLRTYIPRKKGITVVLVAAMPYSEVLEKGSAGLKRKYKVISGANSLMRQLAAEYSGKFGRKRDGAGRGIRTTINPL
jgi:hypothetical protein